MTPQITADMTSGCNIHYLGNTTPRYIHSNTKQSKAESGNATGNKCAHHPREGRNKQRVHAKNTDGVCCDTQAHKFEHYANPMVHPITGETISSLKK
jgi:hypothetical protein